MLIRDVRQLRGQYTAAEVTIKKRILKILTDTKRMLEEKSIILKWVVDKAPFLQEIARFYTGIVVCRKKTLQVYKLEKVGVSFLTKLYVGS